jgi:hypothetical protein
MNLDGSGLIRLLARPTAPTSPTNDFDWSYVEARLGVRLPTDYKQFLGVFGSGEVNGFLLVASPVFGDRLIRLEDLVRSRLEIRRALRAAGWDIPPHPLSPEPGGLLPWGITRNGDTCFWQTTPAEQQDEWTVTVVESKSQEWIDFDGSLTAFLAAVLTRGLVVPFFPQEVFAAHSWFSPLDRAIDGGDAPTGCG